MFNHWGVPYTFDMSQGDVQIMFIASPQFRDELRQAANKALADALGGQAKTMAAERVAVPGSWLCTPPLAHSAKRP